MMDGHSHYDSEDHMEALIKEKIDLHMITTI